MKFSSPFPRLSVVVGALIAGGAIAAESVGTLDSVEGVVKVNKGREFFTPNPGTALAAGDRVMVMVGGKAVVHFADGCDLQLSDGATTTIPATSTCSGGVAQIERVGEPFAQAASPSTSGGASTAAWVGGGLGVAALVGLAASGGGSGGGSDGPISQ